MTIEQYYIQTYVFFMRLAADEFGELERSGDTRLKGVLKYNVRDEFNRFHKWLQRTTGAEYVDHFANLADGVSQQHFSLMRAQLFNHFSALGAEVSGGYVSLYMVYMYLNIAEEKYRKALHYDRTHKDKYCVSIKAELRRYAGALLTSDNVIAAAENGDCDKETFDIVVNNIGKIMEETI